jgi:hypothetical protein
MLLNAGALFRLSADSHPPVQSRGAPFAAAAGLDAGGICNSLDQIAQADFIIPDEAGQAKAEARSFTRSRSDRTGFAHATRLR